jgi:hypothetical protein
MSIVIREHPLGFTQICLHFPGFTRKKRGTRKKVKIAVTQADLDRALERNESIGVSMCLQMVLNHS